MVAKVIGISSEYSNKDKTWKGFRVHVARAPFDFESGFQGLVTDSFSIGDQSYKLLPSDGLQVGKSYDFVRERVGMRDVLVSISPV